MKTTVAVVNSQGADFSLEEVDLADPPADEVLVRIVATGLCHTDIHLKGFLPGEMFPNVFGHEGAGIVEAVGEGVDGIEVGDHVVLSFRSCRACENCTHDLVGYCDSSLLLNYMGMRMDGTTTYSRDGSPVWNPPTAWWSSAAGPSGWPRSLLPSTSGSARWWPSTHWRPAATLPRPTAPSVSTRRARTTSWQRSGN
jgi:hypothetical protein